jgi:hypothetical protein
MTAALVMAEIYSMTAGIKYDALAWIDDQIALNRGSA